MSKGKLIVLEGIDGSGKLAVGMSVKWQRDYTNVDVSGDHAGFVGMGQDTLLKGGNAFGYSTNGRDFNAVITPKGLIFRRPDAERMWRLLKPNEIADINSTVGDKVKKEVDSATAEIPAAVSAANSAVSAAESALRMAAVPAHRTQARPAKRAAGAGQLCVLCLVGRALPGPYHRHDLCGLCRRNGH